MPNDSRFYEISTIWDVILFSVILDIFDKLH